DKWSPNQPPHCRLRDTSPYTLTVDSQRRYGRHRGLGDVVQALVGLHKFSVSPVREALQEISRHLPDGERSQMLDAIQKISKESRRAGAARRAAIKQHVTSSGDRSRGTPSQAYRANSELTGSSEERRSSSERRRLDRLQVGADTLLGTCRAARSQHRSTVLGGGASAYNGAMFLDPPVGRGMTLTSPYGGLMFPCDVGLLQLTEDRQLRLASPDEIMGSQIQDLCYDGTPVGRKREIVT
ncbi:unnamed protein product, partial [Timema podura]|nr:unnamed protein product [Timema podura]